MNDIPVSNWAVGLAVFSFGFLTVGSVLFGATVITAVLRGLGGGMLFGLSLWLVGAMVSKGENLMGETMPEEKGMPGLETTSVKVKSTETKDK